MEALVYIIAAVVLLLLNAFFVLAEFAMVKMRPSRVDELIDAGNNLAKVVKYIQAHLDDYLSVCQVGITFASIGLGFVAEPAVVRFIEPVIAWSGLFTDDGHRWLTAHAIAFAIAYLMVSFLHILLGELVPKSIAIRATDIAATWTAYPLRFFRILFFAPYWVLNTSANAIMRLIGLPATGKAQEHSEDELRIILSRSHSGGMMSFRRLLFMENIFDFGELKVRDAMRPRALVRGLRAGAPWSENLGVVREARYSRFPLIDGPPEKAPLGIVHIKDLIVHHQEGEPQLARIARPFITTHEDAPLESVLTDMQRRRIHIAVVLDKQARWTGFLSMEDIIEEIIGTVEDEFAAEPPIYLGDVLTPARIVLDVPGETLAEAIHAVLRRVPVDELPLPIEVIEPALMERERLVSTYLGYGIAMPHARLPRLVKPALIFARSTVGIPVPGRDDGERVHLLFILLTPAGLPRIHQRLQARIAGILESDFVDSRLREAAEPHDIMEAIRTGEQTSLD
ncbi:MAG: DUF21 domain-containing protein [Planctomycetes bacterium]|nr:DUF21 domain-containing protein [Planctomycetota bacterium]